MAFLGLKGAGIIVADSSTFVVMGNLAVAPAFLALIGIMITLFLYIKKVNAAVFFGLISTAVLGLVFMEIGYGAGNSLMPTLPEHLISFNLDFSLFLGFTRGFGQLFSNIPNLIMILFSLLFVTFFDTTGTLMALGRQCGFIDENGQSVGIEKAFLADAIGGIVGAIFGTSTVSAYVESATGIGLGAKTGLAAIVTGILFIISIFFAPLILALFTPSVTAAALVIVGILMVGHLKDVNWDNPVIAASIFMTVIMMILSYSISIGIAWGFVTYAVATIAAKHENLSPGMWILVIIFVLYLFFGL